MTREKAAKPKATRPPLHSTALYALPPAAPARPALLAFFHPPPHRPPGAGRTHHSGVPLPRAASSSNGFQRPPPFSPRRRRRPCRRPPLLRTARRLRRRASQPRSAGADRHQAGAGRPARRAQELGPGLRRPLQLGHDHLLPAEPRHRPGSAEPGPVGDSVREDRQPHPPRASAAAEQQHHGAAAAGAGLAAAAADVGPLQQPLLRPRARRARPHHHPSLPEAKQQQLVRAVPRVAGQDPAALLPGLVLQQPHWTRPALPDKDLQHHGQPDDMREEQRHRRRGVRRRAAAGRRTLPAGLHSGQQQDDDGDWGGSGGRQVKGWRGAAAHRRRDKPGRLLPCALRRVLLPLAPQAPALPGPLLRPRHPRAWRLRHGGRRRRRGGAAGERAPVRAAGAAGGHGRVQREEHPGQRRVRQRVPRAAPRREHGGREAAQGPGQRVGRGPVPHGGGDDQPRRAPPPAPPRRLLRRRRRAPPRLPLHAQRQRRVAPAREAGAGLGDAEADRGGGGAGPAVPARAVRPEDHPPGREGGQRAAGRAARGRGGGLRPRQAAGPRRLARHHRGARHRGPHRARVPLHGAVVGEDGRLRLRDPAAGARHGPARARARQGLRRAARAPQGRRHARLGEEGASREDAGPAGGPGPGPQLRPDRGGGGGAGGAAVHAVPAVAPAQDVRGGPDAGGRRPRREMGGHEPAARGAGRAVPRRRARLRPPQRLQRLRLLQRLPRQREQPQQRRGEVHRYGGGDGAVRTEVAEQEALPLPAGKNHFLDMIMIASKFTGSERLLKIIIGRERERSELDLLRVSLELKALLGALGRGLEFRSQLCSF